MRHVALILGISLPVCIASAQTFGAITGVVRDPSGAIMPNAPSAATDLATNVAPPASTNKAGVYGSPDLIPATFQVTVSAPGFQTTSAVEIQVQQTARADVALTVGLSTQTVEVSAAAAALTTAGQVGSTLGTAYTTSPIEVALKYIF